MLKQQTLRKKPFIKPTSPINLVNWALFMTQIYIIKEFLSFTQETSSVETNGFE